ncbi:adenosylhomocysteinase [Streptomyces sp. NBC_00723]
MSSQPSTDVMAVRPEQAACIGVDAAGPYEPDHCRY